MGSHHHHFNPNIASFICTTPWHGDARGTAGTGVYADGWLVPLPGLHVYPYPSGDDTWALTCECGINVRRSVSRLTEMAVERGIGRTRVEFDISTM